MRDDWLSMRGYSFYSDRAQYDFAELVAQLKEVMVHEGYEFNCDKY
jgi:hypothetical protein